MFKYKLILLSNYKNEKNQFSLNEYKFIDNISKIFITVLLIVNIYLLNQYRSSVFLAYEDNNHQKNLKLNDYGSIMSGYSLYDLFKYDQITVIINEINNWGINDTSLLNFIDNFKQQTLKDIQIIFVLPSIEDNSKYIFIKNISQNNDKIEIFIRTEKNENDTYYLMNLIKGKFILILEEPIMIFQDELKNVFSTTNGKIDNIFEIQIHNKSLHLIKTKILKNLIDDGMLFNNYTNLINSIFSLPKPHLNYISIAICPDDSYVPLTYVSMISILSSKEEFTFISFYLIISKEFKKKNINFLLSLYEQFDYFNITFIEMNDKYKNAFISRRMTVQTYFRFSLAELFPFLNRILYLDSDIIVYKDLNKLYNLNFNGKMVLGQITGCNNSKKTGIFHINNGILLFNLVQMRKLKIEEKVLKIIKKRERLRYHDQTLMNNYFKEYIGIFPLEYHIRNWGSIKEMRLWNNISGNIYDNDYFYFSQKYPSIRHFLGPYKPMKSNKNHIEDWWYFARISKYYKRKSFKFGKIFSFNKLL